MSKLVFKILKPSATFHGLDYNDRKAKKGSAQLLHYANFGILQAGSTVPSKKDMKAYMEMFCCGNKRIRNKGFHAVLSCKGKSYSLEALSSHALEILSKLGYEGNPIAIYGHNDTAHRHVHILTTRINMDGKKVPHHFEGRRANEILNEILQTDKGELFQAELDHALSYCFSSVAQFTLLMEQIGYRIRGKGDALEFYKYGGKVAAIPMEFVNSKVNSKAVPDLQIKAIIKKYKNLYNVEPLELPKEKYSTAKKEYRTALTEELYKKFGWQFVFFKNPKHEKPYGYVIIDHKKKVVHKGSTILPLHELLSTSDDKLYAKTLQEKENGLSDHQRGTTALTERSRNSTVKYDPAKPLKIVDQIIEQAAFDAEQELNKAHDPKRRKGRYL